MRPIDIQNAIDRVQAGERIMHVRKAEETDEKDRFDKRLSAEVKLKQTTVNDPENSQNPRVEEEGRQKDRYEGRKKKKKQQADEKPAEEEKLKENGKGNILDLNA
jgi:hypothetical protein